MNDARNQLAGRDASARADALDVRGSWLVQAPAGSGKTELLIQRFLALLAIVERPESIVAMTFTRKAAAEMRDRVVDALRRAADDGVAEPLLEHEALTWRLARAALARDRALQWHLLAQPARLRIITIDALAAALARQAPLATGLGALPGFVDDAEALHREAARVALQAASGTDPHWQTFLQWLDNDAATATRLITGMLAARDRWPARIFDDPDVVRRDVERVLEAEVRGALARLRTLIPPPLARRLPPLAALAAQELLASPAPPSFAAALRAIGDAGVLPEADARESWRALAEWLLTKGGTFTRRVTALHGFPGNVPGIAARACAERKAAFAAWLFDAADVPGLADALHSVRALPPARFSDDAWAFVVATMHILPAAADALSRVFSARGEADFTEATLRALMALGNADAPSDLLLAIDYRLSHLLVDEFQDTSRAQLLLIRRLTEGWEPGDGRTLFAVGDPMQSIYRFRQAEVGLFIRAQQERRIGSVPVGVVELTRNFRSQHGIVEWVNAVFSRVLPAESDSTRGEAGYRPAYADDVRGVDVAPTLDLVDGREREAATVVARIRDARAAGLASIAVLVRARTHAQTLLPALRAAGIEFSAVELEGLHDRLATRDLLSLSRALAQPADQLAWLSILHAPWCGLGLADLLTIADASRERTIVEAIADPGVIQQLPAHSRARVVRLWSALAPAIDARGTIPFALRVRGAWLALGGPACAGSALDRAGTDRVFALLAAHERGGDLPDYDTFVATATRLYAETGATDAVQVMTLHRAKGLQFDVVILPGLDLETGGGDPPLLRWKVRMHGSDPTLVLAPMRARIGLRADPDPIYRWLGDLDAYEESAELGRLLYVGATRARHRLHCVAIADADRTHTAWKRPKRGTALERLWDALGTRIPPFVAFDAPDDARSPASTRANESSRLPLDWRLPRLPDRLPIASLAVQPIDAPIFDWADAVAAAIGTVSHRLLAQIAQEGVTAWDERRLQRENERIRAELGGEGLEPALRERAAQRVASVIARTLSDSRGRWLFDAAHEDAHSEWALAGEDDGRIAHIIVDRSFVADGCRYIVDFKTGSHLGGDAGAFLQREFERYRPQLARYARIVGALDARPMRIALYHPLVDGGWRCEDLVK